MIEVVVNGEARQLPRVITIATVLAEWGYQYGKVALAVNGEFVARSEYGTRMLQAGDVVEVVAPVQGG